MREGVEDIASAILPESSPHPGGRRMYITSRGGCTNALDTSKWKICKPSSFRVTAIIFTGADADAGGCRRYCLVIVDVLHLGEPFRNHPEFRLDVIAKLVTLITVTQRDPAIFLPRGTSFMSITLEQPTPSNPLSSTFYEYSKAFLKDDLSASACVVEGGGRFGFPRRYLQRCLTIHHERLLHDHFFLQTQRVLQFTLHAGIRPRGESASRRRFSSRVHPSKSVRRCGPEMYFASRRDPAAGRTVGCFPAQLASLSIETPELPLAVEGADELARPFLQDEAEDSSPPSVSNETPLYALRPPAASGDVALIDVDWGGTCSPPLESSLLLGANDSILSSFAVSSTELASRSLRQ